MGQLLSSPARARHGKDQIQKLSRPWSSESRTIGAGKSTITHVDSGANGRNEIRRKKGKHQKTQISKDEPRSGTNASSRSHEDFPYPQRRMKEADRHGGRTWKSSRTKSRVSRTKPSVQVTELKNCVVCTDTRSLHRFPSRPPTASCSHEPCVCRRCLRTWIQSEFNTKMWNEISCPICLAHMEYDDIRDFAPHDIFRRYEKLSTKAAYEAIPNFRWCIARRCKSGQVHDPSAARFRCRACKKSHCVHHEAMWHRGETCQEYDYRTDRSIKHAQELASKRCIKETTKKCPGCRRSIEKSFGCDHMTCSRCRHEFCWQCLAPYLKKGGRRVVHTEGCEYDDLQWEIML